MRQNVMNVAGVAHPQTSDGGVPGDLQFWHSAGGMPSVSSAVVLVLDKCALPYPTHLEQHNWLALLHQLFSSEVYTAYKVSVKNEH